MSNALRAQRTLGFVVLLTLTMLAPRQSLAQLPAGFAPAWKNLVTEHRKTLESIKMVGGTLAFVHAGEIVGVDYYGMSDIESQRKVDENTLYHWASITKTFTGVGVMQLKERGLITLEDPIVKYVPELRKVHNRFGPMEDITVRHLLTHSSGFRGRTWPWADTLASAWQPHEPTEWSQLVSMIPYTEIMYKPGSRNTYSNPGSIFLGRVIEDRSGDVFEHYIEKNIFRPLGMTTAYFDITPWYLKSDRSNNYRMIKGQPVANGLEFNTGITVANGGLNATVRDLAKWTAFLMYAPRTKERPNYDHVLKSATLDEMWRPFQPPQGNSPLGTPGQGLHFFTYDADGHRIIGHTGGQKSFVTFFYVDPDADVAIIGAYNTAGGDETAPNTRSVFTLAQTHARQQLFPLFWKNATRTEASR